MISIKSAGRAVFLASERCQVLKVLDLATVSQSQVDSLLSSDAAGFLPADPFASIQACAADIEGGGQCPTKTMARAICCLPLAALSLSDASGQQDSCTEIKELDAWMSEVDIRAGVCRAFPRAALVQEVL